MQREGLPERERDSSVIPIVGLDDEFDEDNKLLVRAPDGSLQVPILKRARKVDYTIPELSTMAVQLSEWPMAKFNPTDDEIRAVLKHYPKAREGVKAGNLINFTPGMKLQTSHPMMLNEICLHMCSGLAHSSHFFESFARLDNPKTLISTVWDEVVELWKFERFLDIGKPFTFIKYTAMIRISEILPRKVILAMSKKVLRILSLAAEMKVAHNELYFDCLDRKCPAAAKYRHFNELMKGFNCHVYSAHISPDVDRLLAQDEEDKQIIAELCEGKDPTLLSPEFLAESMAPMVNKGRQMMRKCEAGHERQERVFDELFVLPNLKKHEGGRWIPSHRGKHAKLVNTCLNYSASKELAMMVQKFLRTQPEADQRRNKLIENYLNVMALLWLNPVPVTFQDICSFVGVSLFSSHKSCLQVVDALLSKTGLPFEEGHAELVRAAAKEIRNAGLIPVSQAKPSFMHQLLERLQEYPGLLTETGGTTLVLQCAFGMRSIEAHLLSFEGEEGQSKRCFQMTMFEPGSPSEARVTISTRGIKTQENGRQAIISSTCWCRGNKRFEDHCVCNADFRKGVSKVVSGCDTCALLRKINLYGDGVTGHSPRVGLAIMSVKTNLSEMRMKICLRWRSPSMPARYANDENRYPLSAGNLIHPFHNGKVSLTCHDMYGVDLDRRFAAISVAEAQENMVDDDALSAGSLADDGGQFEVISDEGSEDSGDDEGDALAYWMIRLSS